MKHIISLGAGVQSSTMALMAEHGEITPYPDAAIFADTQAEPESVYKWLSWLENWLSFPVYHVTVGSLAARALDMKVTKDGKLYSKTDIPFFTLNGDGSQGKIVQRGCTRDFKLAPLRKQQRILAGIKRGQKTVGVVSWQGISIDEVYRMRDSRDPWCEIRYPLIEKKMTRQDCIRWMKEHDYPEPPRSACVFCPYHSNKEWRRLKEQEPEAFKKAAEFEKQLQDIKAKSTNFSSTPFLHKSCVPLEKVDLSTLEDHGQTNMFNNECEGMCGV